MNKGLLNCVPLSGTRCCVQCDRPIKRKDQFCIAMRHQPTVARPPKRKAVTPPA